MQLGYYAGGGAISLTTQPVFRRQQPTGAIVTMNIFSHDTVVPSININGTGWIDTPWPFDNTGFYWRTIAIPVPNLASVVDGPNTIQVTSTSPTAVVSNINLILVAGAPVP
jgi:hypothetical protein